MSQRVQTDSMLGWRSGFLSIAPLADERLRRRDYHVGGRGSRYAGAQRRQQHLVIAAVDRCATDKFDAHAGSPLFVDIERLGGSNREVNDAVVYKRPPIVDPHDDRATIVETGNTRITRQRHRAMRRRDPIHVVALAVRSAATVEVGAIPRSNPFGAIRGIGG